MRIDNASNGTANKCGRCTTINLTGTRIIQISYLFLPKSKPIQIDFFLFHRYLFDLPKVQNQHCIFCAVAYYVPVNYKGKTF